MSTYNNPKTYNFLKGDLRSDILFKELRELGLAHRIADELINALIDVSSLIEKVINITQQLEKEETNMPHGATIEEVPPTPNNLPAIWDLVIMDMQARDVTGQIKYGTRLQPFNGRSPLWDAYQEALDLCVYLRQAIYEQEKEKNNGPK